MNEHLAELRYQILEPYIPEGFVGGEIGVFKGHFSRVLLRKKPKKLYLVDPWYRVGNSWTWVKGQNPSTLDAFNEIMRYFDAEIRAGTVVPVPEFSIEFMRIAPMHSFDLLYLDSSHSYADTVAELELARRLLKPNGVLLGDDWHIDPEHRHYGVAKAVLECVDKGEAQMLFSPKELQWGLRYTQLPVIV